MITFQQGQFGRRVVGGAETDPFFANVVFLLHGDGDDDSTTIVDSGPSGLSPTNVVNTTIQDNQIVGASEPYVRYASNAAFALPQIFTFEFSVTFDSLALPVAYFMAKNASQLFALGSSGALNWTGKDFGSGYSAGVKYKLAMTRDGSNTFRTFRDGTLLFSETFATTYGSSDFALFSVPSRTDLKGPPAKIEEVRITLGVCRYTGNYTPDSAPFPDA